MTEHTDEVFDDATERQAMEDLELITRMLNNQLDPERVEAVKERLKTDAAFRDLAEQPTRAACHFAAPRVAEPVA